MTNPMNKILYKIAICLYSLVGRCVSACTKAQATKVVMNCNQGRGYICNPKYIAEALERLYPGKYQLYLLVKHHDDNAPEYIRQVSYYGLSAIWHQATARFWIANARAIKLVPKRNDQFYIQTWHATISPKIVERDAGDKLPLRYQTMAQLDGQETDLMFADNDFAEELYRRGFWYTGPVLRCGVPRNKPLIHPSEDTRHKVLRVLGIPTDKKIVLYAPTFRNDYSLSYYNIDVESCCSALEARFGGSFVFVWRLHPNFARYKNEMLASSARCFDGTDYLDAQEIIAASDILISDYSSTIDDFAFTRRPAFMFATDIDDYIQERGFYYPLSERPYSVARNMAELTQLIESYSYENAELGMAAYMKKFNITDDGHGDELLARLIDNISSPDANLDDFIEKDEEGHLVLKKEI